MYSGTESKDVKLESENSQSEYNACEEKTGRLDSGLVSRLQCR